MKNTFQKLSLWRLITAVISVCFTASLNAQSPTASFTYNDMTTQGGISISTNGITGKKTGQNFCKDGSTQIKNDVISLDQSAGSDPTVKFIMIESTSDITSISFDASYNSTGASTKDVVVACWKDGNTDISNPDYIYTVGVLGYDKACSSALVSQAIGTGVRVIRIYRKVKFSGTEYGGGTTTAFNEIQVFAGAACADRKPTISGTFSSCAASTTLSVSGQTAGATLRWYKDNVAIGGATNETYTATADGNYKVVATKNCDVSSDAVAVAVNLPTPSDPIITQTGNTVTISGTGGDIQYSLDGGTSWTTGTSFSITQDETVKAKITNSCGTSDVVTYNATYTDAPTCAYIGDGAGTLDATTPYDFGDYKMYISGAAPTYTTSTAQLCGTAKKRYMANEIILYMSNASASQITIVGTGKDTPCEFSDISVSDALDGTYTSISHGTVSNTINGCGEMTIPGISVKQGQYVKITFGSNAVRISGICIVPRVCAPTINATTSTIFNCGTNNNTTLTVTELTPGDGSNVGTWSSEDPSIATVNASGVVTGKAVGQVNIIFTPTNAEFCPAKKTITVSQVTLDGYEEVGEGKFITLTPNVAGGTWSSNKPGVATVTGGTVTGVSGGTATITYTVNGCTATHDVTVLPNLSVITPPVLSVPTIDGFTANWTASGETGVNGYILYIYNAVTGAEVKALTIPGQATDQAIISGLDPNTQYYAKIKVQGNGSTTTDSDLSPVSNTITTLKARVASTCLTESFEDLTGGSGSSSYCPDPDVPGTQIRMETSSPNACASEMQLSLNGGIWKGSYLCGMNNSSAFDGSKYIYYKRNGYLESPVVEQLMEVSFRIKAYTATSSSNLCKDDRGWSISINGATINASTSNYTLYVDGAPVEFITPVESGTKVYAQYTNTGKIRFTDTEWHEVKIKFASPENAKIRISSTASQGSEDAYIDNFNFKCDPQELIITPDLDGLSYVKDLGPSDAQDITISGSNLPVETGVATLNGVDDFEISLDNGVTWTSGGTVNIPYTGGSFAKSVKVRLPKDKDVNTYSDVFTLSATGYTKTSPSVTVEGEVTLFPIVLNCGQAVEVLRLMSPGLDQDHPSFMDLAAEKNWTTSGTVSSNKNALGAYSFKLQKSGLTSPSINANNYDFLRLTFDVQPANSNSSGNNLLVQVYGANGYIYNETLALPDKQIYHQTIDLQSSVTMGNYSVIINSPNQTFYVTNIILEGTAKRKFNFEAEAFDDFQSYPDCPSDVKEITVYGTCLDDDKSIDFTSYKNFGNEKYEFSANGVDGWSSALSIPYSGAFPLRGMKVYVRQKEGLEAGSVNDVILVQNGGRGSAFISLSGQATAAGTWYPADGAVYNFSSVSGQAEEFAIPFTGGPFCLAPTVSTSCPGVTVSNCKGGSYATTTTFPATITEGKIYVKYTPGTLTNCNIQVTAAGETHNVKVNWNGGTAVSTGVELSASTVKVPSGGIGTVQATAKGGDMNAQVTITSDKFDVSMGNPAYGDFSAITTTKLDNMTGTLYIRPKAGATGSGTITFSTDGGSDVVLNCTIE